MQMTPPLWQKVILILGMLIVLGVLLFLKVLVAQSCSTFYDLMDCSLPGSSVHGILQARILE